MRRYGDMRIKGRGGNRWADVDKRFWSKVKMTDTCWIWLAADNGLGYGMFRHEGRYHLAYRFAYERLVGPIPKGLVIDHLCRNPACVRPEHLEPVTQRVNTLRGNAPSARQARQTHCKRGHELDPYAAGRKRQCVACRRLRARLKYAAKKASAGPRPPRVRKPRRMRSHCLRGHPYSAENTRIDKRGTQVCRTCMREHQRKWKAREAEKAKAATEA